MNRLASWTLELIREDDQMGWMEERRLEWVPPADNAARHLINGTTLIIVTDKEREWFGKHLMGMLNNPDKSRPFLSIFNSIGIFDQLERLTGSEELDLLTNMLNMSLNSNYIFWYIGKGDDIRAKLPKKKEGSFLWIMDEEIQNSFFLRSSDLLLDIKLMHLARLFDKTIDAMMFGEL